MGLGVVPLAVWALAALGTAVYAGRRTTRVTLPLDYRQGQLVIEPVMGGVMDWLVPENGSLQDPGPLPPPPPIPAPPVAPQTEEQMRGGWTVEEMQIETIRRQREQMAQFQLSLVQPVQAVFPDTTVKQAAGITVGLVAAAVGLLLYAKS